ncbi:MAG TPA: hypothetical protein VFZ66_24830 [Herpetosiphonaceae bacterium]
MVEGYQRNGAEYRAQLADIIRRAAALEAHARKESTAPGIHDPQRAAWTRIERRYATVRGNAQHLLLIHERIDQRRKPLFRFLRYLNLL